MKVVGLKGKKMVKENIFVKMEIVMKESEKMTNETDMVLKY